MFRSIILASVAAAIVAAPPVRAGAQTGSGDFSVNERVAQGSWVRIHTYKGRINVVEGTGETVEVRGSTREDDRDRDVQFEMVRGRDGITVCAYVREYQSCDADGIESDRRNWGRGDRWPSAHFEVRLPKGVKLAARSGNGDITVTGAGADVEASSGNGRVRVTTTAGAVRATTGNGEVTVEGATDEVEASSGNGRIRVGTTTGPVRARSGNGDIEVEMAAIRGDGDMDFSTGNGTVSVTVPANFNGELDASTGHGRIRADFPITLQGRINPQRIRATIGTGGRRVRMHTGNGDVELIKRELR